MSQHGEHNVSLCACLQRRMPNIYAPICYKPAVAGRLLSFCANVAACLPFKRCDEPYMLLHLINSTISRRGAFVLSAQKASLQPEAGPTSDPDPSAVPGAVNGIDQAAAQNGSVQGIDEVRLLSVHSDRHKQCADKCFVSMTWC